MDIEAALELADALVFATTGKHLNDLQGCVFREAWQGKSFTEIAEACNCNESHAKEVGSQFWKLLSSALGETVGKRNFKAALERYWRAQQSGNISSSHASVVDRLQPSAPDPNFVGRESAIAEPDQEERCTDRELEIKAKIQRTLEEKANISQELLFGVEEYITQLKEYLQDKEGSWFISVVGTGGVGKTSLVENLVRNYTVEAGFIELAWVTAKRTIFSIENRSIQEQNIEPALNIDDLLYKIAEQLDLKLPSVRDEQFSYLQSKLRSAPYLIVIDNLETLQDYTDLLTRFNPHSQRKNLRPSKIIFTSREKIQRLTMEVREIELKGIGVKPSLELIRYKGKHIQRLYAASDNELLLIFNATNGIPLLLLLVVSMIATDDSPLDEIIQSLSIQNELYTYLYEEALKSISENAFTVLTSMTCFSDSIPVPRRQLKQQSELSDEEFKEAVGECIQRSLLTSISRLSDEPRYSIHNLLYEFLKELESSEQA
ncbi:MAG: NB-ARC domain-containing protein [Cyanobacteriota bacterium]